MTEQEQRIASTRFACITVACAATRFACITAACVVLSLIVGGAIVIPRWITESNVRAQAQELARQLSGQLAELPEGRTEFLTETDAWGREFKAVFVVGDYIRSVTVSSVGRDGVADTGDDISGRCSRTDVAKAIGDTVERGAKRVGKGFTDGVLDSLKGDEDVGILDRFRRRKDK